jgi:TrmH family RNA methyltransferase
MLSKSQISLIKSLHQKKFRKEHQLFIVEGLKAFTEFLNSSYTIQSIYCLTDIIPKLPILSYKQKVFEVTLNELQKISALQTPQGIIAIIEIPNYQIFNEELTDGITLVLDGIQDPGNLGTIIRTADWFGFKNILCSINTVDIYNPKVIQATMGSIARVNVFYANLTTILNESNLPKYGTLLNGENLFKTNWPNKGYIIFGSEGNGITQEILPMITHPITIPGNGSTESLNVAISAAICCAEIKRNMFK